MSSGEEQTYEDAKRIAIRWITHIAMLETTEKVVIVGSLRRKQLKINDIDIQVIGSHYDIENLFWSKGVGMDSGDTKRQIYTLKSGVMLNVFYTTRDSWGSSLMHNTGSKTYNIRKRLRSQAEGYKLNQYGVWTDDGMKVDGGVWDTEKKIYDFFGWTYVEPEDRE